MYKPWKRMDDAVRNKFHFRVFKSLIEQKGARRHSFYDLLIDAAGAAES